MDMMPQRVRHASKAKGWSQAELAKRAGTEQAHISRQENVEVGGFIDLITRIARELDVTASQLIGDDAPTMARSIRPLACSMTIARQRGCVRSRGIQNW